MQPSPFVSSSLSYVLRPKSFANPAQIDARSASPGGATTHEDITAAGAQNVQTDRLRALPAELQFFVLDHLEGDEDTQERLGAMSHYWQQEVASRRGPRVRAALEACQAGDRHGLSRALGAPHRATRFVSHPDSAGGMTPLMHAARTGHRAMVRCLLRCSDPPVLRLKDRADLTAWHWAALANRHAEFEQDVRRVGHVIPWDTRQWPCLTVHRSIAKGHPLLAQTLLEPHFKPHWYYQDHPSAHSGYAAGQRMACGQSLLACALMHDIYQTGMFDIVATRSDQPPLTPEALMALAPKLRSRRRAWLPQVQTLARYGFNIDAHTADQPSFFDQWLQAPGLTLLDTRHLDSLSGDIFAPTARAQRVLEMACTQNQNAFYSLDSEQLLCALIEAGVRPSDGQTSANAAARAIVRRVPLSAQLLRQLIAQGAQLDAEDAAGRTLAHSALQHQTRAVYLNTLLTLSAAGLDVQKTCDAGVNPLMDSVLSLAATRKELLLLLERLLDVGIDFHRPGRVETLHAAHKANHWMDAALMAGKNKLANCLLMQEQSCTLVQMQQTLKRLDALGTKFDRAWLTRHIVARKIGLCGFDSIDINVAGGWHAALSRSRLRAARDTARQRYKSSESRHHLSFWQTVRASGLAGAVVARTAVLPLTYAVDTVLGTQRSQALGAPHTPLQRFCSESPGRPKGEYRAEGILGLGAGCAAAAAKSFSTAVVGTALWSAGKMVQPADNCSRVRTALCHPYRTTDQAGQTVLDYAVLYPLVQSAAILGCVPKAAASAVGFGAGAIIGVGKGLMQRARR